MLEKSKIAAVIILLSCADKFSMKHIDCMTPQGRRAEADFFRKNKKDWVKVKLFAYHVSFEFCMENTSLESSLKYLDDNIESIEQEEEKYCERWSELND